MKKLTSTLVVSTILALAGAAVASPDIEDPASRVRATTLPNGLTVLTLEDHTTPVVSFQMWVKVGSRDEARFTGIAHLFEHMMFRGSANLGPEEHARLINARGGRLNAYTSRDVTVYFEDVTSESLPLVIDLEAERVANLNINAEILDTERKVVLEERQLRTEDSPDGRIFEALTALVWTAHPYRWPVIGWRSDVEKVDVDACRDFFDNYYVPNNLVIVMVGDFDTEPVLARVEQRFGALEPNPVIPRNPTEEPEQRGERRQTVYFDVRAPLLAAAWHAPAAGHPDSPALDVASFVLSQGRSSRLYRKLVYEEQAALYAQGGYWELKDAGLFYALAGVRPGKSVDEVEALFFGEVRKIAVEGVGPEELDKAKRQLEVALVNGLVTNHELADRFGSDQVVFGRIRPLEERLASIQSVTAEDVQRVVRTYLIDEKRSVVHLVAPVAEENR